MNPLDNILLTYEESQGYRVYTPEGLNRLKFSKTIEDGDLVINREQYSKFDVFINSMEEDEVGATIRTLDISNEEREAIFYTTWEELRESTSFETAVSFDLSDEFSSVNYELVEDPVRLNPYLEGWYVKVEDNYVPCDQATYDRTIEEGDTTEFYIRTVLPYVSTILGTVDSETFAIKEQKKIDEVGIKFCGILVDADSETFAPVHAVDELPEKVKYKLFVILDEEITSGQEGSDIVEIHYKYTDCLPLQEDKIYTDFKINSDNPSGTLKCKEFQELLYIGSINLYEAEKNDEVESEEYQIRKLEIWSDNSRYVGYKTELTEPQIMSFNNLKETYELRVLQADEETYTTLFALSSPTQIGTAKGPNNEEIATVYYFTNLNLEFENIFEVIDDKVEVIPEIFIPVGGLLAAPAEAESEEEAEEPKYLVYNCVYEDSEHQEVIVRLEFPQEQEQIIGNIVYATLTVPVSVEIKELEGAALLNFGNVDADNQAGNNYGIAINSSDDFLNLPARAISLFKSKIDPDASIKISYDYQGILGTLPNTANIIDKTADVYANYMAGTQGIYTDNMYIGDENQFIAFYGYIDRNGNEVKNLRISAKEIIYDIQKNLVYRQCDEGYDRDVDETDLTTYYVQVENYEQVQQIVGHNPYQEGWYVKDNGEYVPCDNTYDKTIEADETKVFYTRVYSYNAVDNPIGQNPYRNEWFVLFEEDDITSWEDHLDRGGLNYIWYNLSEIPAHDNVPTYYKGAYMASGIEDKSFDRSDANTYGYNSLLTEGSLNFRYNDKALISAGNEGLGIYSIEKDSVGLPINSHLKIKITGNDGIQMYSEGVSENNEVPLIQINGDKILMGVGGSSLKRVSIGQEGFAFLDSSDSEEKARLLINSDGITIGDTTSFQLGNDDVYIKFFQVGVDGDEEPVYDLEIKTRNFFLGSSQQILLDGSDYLSNTATSEQLNNAQESLQEEIDQIKREGISYESGALVLDPNVPKIEVGTGVLPNSQGEGKLYTRIDEGKISILMGPKSNPTNQMILTDKELIVPKISIAHITKETVNNNVVEKVDGYFWERRTSNNHLSLRIR